MFFARAQVGGGDRILFRYVQALRAWYYSILSELSSASNKLQAQLRQFVLDRPPARERPRQILFRRIRAWFPLITQQHMDMCFISSYLVLSKSQPYMLVAAARILRRGLCTTN